MLFSFELAGVMSLRPAHMTHSERACISIEVLIGIILLIVIHWVRCKPIMLRARVGSTVTLSAIFRLQETYQKIAEQALVGNKKYVKRDLPIQTLVQLRCQIFDRFTF